jgi:hypothetical protein
MADHHTEEGVWSTAAPPQASPRPHGMSQEEASSLFNLRLTWEGRYQVSFTKGTWQAARVGSSGDFSLTADTAEQLGQEIREDSRAWSRE